MEQEGLGGLQLWHCQCWRNNVFFKFPKWNPWDLLHVCLLFSKCPVAIILFCGKRSTGVFLAIHGSPHMMFLVNISCKNTTCPRVARCLYRWGLLVNFFYDALSWVMGVIGKALFTVNSERIALASGLRIGGASTRKAGLLALVHEEVKFVTFLVFLDVRTLIMEQMFLSEGACILLRLWLSDISASGHVAWRPNSCSSVLICWGKWDVPRPRGVQEILTLKLLRACSSDASARCDEILV